MSELPKWYNTVDVANSKVVPSLGRHTSAKFQKQNEITLGSSQQTQPCFKALIVGNTERGEMFSYNFPVLFRLDPVTRMHKQTVIRSAALVQCRLIFSTWAMALLDKTIFLKPSFFCHHLALQAALTCGHLANQHRIQFDDRAEYMLALCSRSQDLAVTSQHQSIILLL